ncbi:hypothetical protein EO93_11160 [Methanosarcina sp. 1.H.A.2.2]|nr:hypothetical protein EO93_11160 [Methanosarcina sp. 1.H.A.2.2]
MTLGDRGREELNRSARAGKRKKHHKRHSTLRKMIWLLLEEKGGNKHRKNPWTSGSSRYGK